MNNAVAYFAITVAKGFLLSKHTELLRKIEIEREREREREKE